MRAAAVRFSTIIFSNTVSRCLFTVLGLIPRISTSYLFDLPQQRMGQNLMYTVSVNLAGYDNVFYYFGEGTICNYDGNVIQQGQRNPWEIVTAELFPRLADKARENWALENNIFDLGCRAFVGKPGGEKANYLTLVRDLANGEYKLPWDDKVKIRDGWKYYPNGGQYGPMPEKFKKH